MADSKSNGVATTVANIRKRLEKEKEVKDVDASKHKITAETVSSSETKRIIIPEGMDKREAAQDLLNQYENEETMTNFQASFENWDWKDTLRAILVVTEEMFGWLKGEHGWFSTPTEISVVVDIKDGASISEKVYYGKIGYPAWEGAQGSIGVNENGDVSIVINAKKKFRMETEEYFNAVRNHLNNRSIYRGRSVSIQQDKNGRINLNLFEARKNDNIVLNEDTEGVIENFVIEQLGEKGKRTFLFTGAYGNGKTETAIRVGAQGNAKGVAFFYVEDSKLLPRVLKLATNYEPAIVFLEDIDEVASGEDRGSKINNILNTLDGALTKGRNILTIFTTNNQRTITPALRRPGRIDLIVNFDNPDKVATREICEKFFNNLQGGNEIDYEVILPKIPDVSGAVVAEMCKRAVILAARKGGISTAVVSASIDSMRYQIEFMKEEVENKNRVQNAFEVLREYMAHNTEFGG